MPSLILPYHPYKPASRMLGPFRLEAEQVRTLDPDPGAYLLANSMEGRRRVCYVGRANTSLRRRLANWIGEYDWFYYRVTNDHIDAFHLECAEFHRYGKVHRLDNQQHPERPKGTSLFLDLCSELGCEGEDD